MSSYNDSFELNKKISELPRGYVTQKKINEKIYNYHQWKDDNGKMHYDSVSEEDAAILRKQVELRKELQKNLRSLGKTEKRHEGRYLMEAGVAYGKTEFSNDFDFEVNAMYGSSLRNMADAAKGLKKRDCYGILEKYIYGKQSDKVCLIYGLRRTGKTTLLRQLILGMKDADFTKSLYIKATTADTMVEMNKAMKLAVKGGFKYLFIDEVTLISDFIDSASLFSDVYAAQGLKIILSGTDSLGFYFASNEELYDRAVMVHTTYIPYREHARLLGITSIDDYIRYGGTLKAGELRFGDDEDFEEASFRDDESTRRYIDTAICKNIQHSLACYEEGTHFRNLKRLYDAHELTNVINRIIQDMNHDFTKEVILKEFVSRDLRSSAQMLRSAREPEKRTDALNEIDTSDVIKKLKGILDIKENEELSEIISEAVLTEIKEYLKALDLIEYIKIESNAAGTGDLWRTIFTQPGMRYCQAQALVYLIMRNEEFKALSEREKLLISSKILEDVRGIMLEDIVLLETQKALGKNKRVFKLQFDVGEIDMVIYDQETDSCELYEIKHSSERADNQWKPLMDEKKLDHVRTIYGMIKKRCVLYSGETEVLSDGREYRNVEEYLSEM
ncbi:AAA domain-containing protein [Butyrivibrio sp. ob235]|uniref:AAA family ATPase n=1 Tax=Butyrivibrio sp. ob235 TaxID=1761780 RepID=UPI0008CEE269|nr:AAA family ATPase [Butyrivibrio sp. ob235]SEM25019.1 AAA domain-containing protein [Butyrivibrio sp. ob235]